MTFDVFSCDTTDVHQLQDRLGSGGFDAKFFDRIQKAFVQFLGPHKPALVALPEAGID